MPLYTIQPNDCIVSIANFHGFSPESIWEHSENTSLRERRQNPNILSCGDQVFVPDILEGEHDGNTDELHRFVRHSQKSILNLMLKVDDDPIADANYTLEINGVARSGRTDSEGRIEEPIPPDATQGYLSLDDWGLIRLELGRLNPVDSIEGIQQRLSNLGFHCGPIDGLKGPKTEGAIRAWQQEKGLIVDGIIGLQTRGSLKSKYGC